MPQSSNDNAKQRHHMERRRFIYESIAKKRLLSVADLHEKFNKVADELLKGDIAFFQSLGIDIQSVRINGRRTLIDASAAHNDTKLWRRPLRKVEKKLVASVAVGLIAGFPPFLEEADDLLSKTAVNAMRKAEEAAMEAQKNKQTAEARRQWDLCQQALAEMEPAQNQERRLASLNAMPPVFKNCWNISQIRASLTNAAQGPAAAHARYVLNKLESLWKELHRSIAIDAGTTNDQIGHYLNRLALPCNAAALARLTVCTNSRGIFQMLGGAHVGAKVIMIGGEQIGRTEAVAGRLSELFLKSAEVLQFGISFIGATAVNLADMHICSDSSEEANLKALLYQRSALRIACFDNHKLVGSMVRESYPFVAIQPDQVDLIITNEPVPVSVMGNVGREIKESQQRKIEEFPSLVEKIRLQGVPVLLGKMESEDGD
jgi:DeoR/GlpR family transcriptional regulator of sugar metabolism